RSRLLCWDERWFFLEQRFVRDDDQVAFALVKVQFRGRQGRVQPQQVMDAFARGMASPPMPAAVREWQEAERALADGREPAPAVV
ncbi:MAG TPA: hypothetical protein VEW03_11810, partial [Longimicrobiaceae bacterium]|nr:hypothetical protein [Longimicrobiaceae bacterium]